MQDIPIKEYAYQIWKRRRQVLLFLGIVMSLAVLFTYNQTKVYRAVATIEIGAETPDTAFFQDVVNMAPYYGWWSALRYYETQYQIIQSRSMLSKVAQEAVETGEITGMSVGALTNHLQHNLSLGTDDNSRLVKLYFDDSDPQRAMKLANLIADVYAKQNLSQKLQGVDNAVQWLNERLKEIRKEKELQEKELQRFKEEFKVVSVEDRENLAKNNLNALTDSLNHLKSRRIEIEAQYRKLRQLVKGTEGVEDLLGVVTSELLSKLKADHAELLAQRSHLSQRYMAKHPKIIQLNARIEATEKAIRQEVENEVSRLRTKYLLAKAEEDSVAQALEKQKMEALRIDRVNRKLSDIKLLTDMNQEIYETLQKKLKEADLSALVRSNNIRVVDRALEPGSPIRPQWGINLLFGLFVGLLGGIGLALAMEYMDDTIKTHDDIERYLNLPVLGMIPHLKTDTGNGEIQSLPFLPYDDPRHTISEFYRTLRTNVLFLSATKGSKKIMMVSTGPSEGKTVTVANLAVTFAQLGQRVVVIDLDFRRPKIHETFMVKNEKGVTNVLVGQTKLEDAIRESRVPNLHFIPAGSLPPNPAELLGSDAVAKFLEDLSKQFDRVIIDSSPVAPVADATIVAQKVDGVMLLVRAAKAHRKAVLLAKEQLLGVKANVMGVILNDVNLESSAYSNYQYYKYGYTVYGKEEKKSSEGSQISKKDDPDLDPPAPTA